MGERRWYVVKTLPRREVFAEQQLQNQGFTTFLPKQVRTVRHARRTHRVISAFFPAYLFVQMDVSKDRWRSINGTYGVSHILTQGDRPSAAPVGVVEDLISGSDTDAVVVSGPWLEIGQQVRITQGPLAQHMAVVERMGNADSVRVLLEIMGAHISVEANRAHLASAA